MAVREDGVGSRTESGVCADGRLRPLNVNQLEYHTTTQSGGFTLLAQSD
jgi:hypothetical protein